jgi:osmotically-inducible protein OsmY
MNINKLLLTIAVSAPLLQGCVTTAAIVGATTVGLVVYDSRSSKTMIDDHNISYKAQNIINQDAQLKDHSSIAVTSFNHVVLLTGEADNESLKDHAGSIINGINGIKHIYNKITIGPKVSMETLSNDTLITTKVKAELLKEKNLRTIPIKVITQNGIVYLMGLISRNEGVFASKVTQKVPGVNRVVKVFEYTP